VSIDLLEEIEGLFTEVDMYFINKKEVQRNAYKF